MSIIQCATTQVLEMRLCDFETAKTTIDKTFEEFTHGGVLVPKALCRRFSGERARKESRRNDPQDQKSFPFVVVVVASIESGAQSIWAAVCWFPP